ncbi:MAG: HipA N-terminal domain-containing protein [Streptosporangiaceae bacterium]
MSDSLIVLLGRTTAGTVTRLRGGQLRFDYDDEYRLRPGVTPLSVSMPTQIRSHTDQVVTPWLWNLLPDNDSVIDRWARRFQVSASPFALLGTPIGLDCAGAVRFIPPEMVEHETSRPGDVTWLTDDEVAERLRELTADSAAWLGKSFTGQFSLAGAQAKTALLYQDGRWGIPRGDIATTHILKPAVTGFDDHDLNEHLCLDAARRAKNYSLLLADGEVRLAPLYDIASALPYGTHERKLRLAMKIGGEYRISPISNTWRKAADELGIDNDLALGRVRELTGRVAGAFAEAAETPEVTALGRDLPRHLVTIIADRAARCMKIIAA